jgi:O-antigen/teichoic acid export membrane protein
VTQRKDVAILIIRALSIGLKTSFIFFAAKFLNLEDFGKLALINTAMSLMLCVMSVNFISYTSRYLIETSDFKKGISNHFLFTSFMALVSFLASPLLIKYGGIDSGIIITFLLILFLEHLTTEVFRVLIPLNKIVQANIVHFLKVSCSSFFPLIIIFSKNGEANLETVLDTWLISLTVLVIALAIFYIKYSHLKELKFSLSFIKSGLKTSFVYLAISILGRSLFTIDKFIVNSVSGTTEVGIYSFYYSMAFTMQTLVETSFITPSMYEMLKSSNLKKSYHELVIKVILAGSLIGGSLVFAKSFIFKILNKEDFLKDFNLLYIFIIAALNLSMALATMMPLYAKRRDREILISYFIAFILFVVLNIAHNTNIYSVALNMAFTSFILFIMLFIQVRKILNRN